MTLEQLLEKLGCPENDREYERAWGEFLKRYRASMEERIIRRCYSWNIPRLSLQTTDVADDIFGEVLEYLCKDDARKLREFRNRDNEYKFRAWLAIICNQAVSRHLKKHLTKQLSRLPISEDKSLDRDLMFREYDFRNLPPDPAWELYEFLVTTLRSANKKTPTNFERDIHIYLLYEWADFNDETIFNIPLFRSLGKRVIDNVVYRMRQILRQHLETL